jgi:hypothetical protein
MHKTIQTGQKHRIACSRVSLRSPWGIGRTRSTLYSHRSWRLSPRLSVITEPQVADHFTIALLMDPENSASSKIMGPEIEHEPRRLEALRIP